MSPPLVLWLDFAPERKPRDNPLGPRHPYKVKYCNDMQALPQLLATETPDVLCFDFTYPGPSELALLQKTKLSHPSVPILMLTDNPSAELAIWALRSRVWDYFIKPTSGSLIARRINAMEPLLKHNHGQRPRRMLMPDRGTSERNIYIDNRPKEKTCKIIPYLRDHLHEKITLSDVAHLCCMSVCEFSRTFKREQGMTFRDYLVRLRVDAAADILHTTSRSVLEIACSVGVNDPSQFSRLFRRHMGTTPSAYRSMRRDQR